MIIVGLHNTGTSSAACILRDGKVVFAAAEERFNRQKHSKYFPLMAMARGLDEIDACLDQVDGFAIAWNPAINLAGRFRAGYSEWPAFPGERLYSNLNHILPRLSRQPENGTSQIVNLGIDHRVQFDYVDHHQAHAAFSFLPSPFEEAAILIIDGYGERTATVLAVGRGQSIEVLRRDAFPNSLGSFYSAVTQHLGFCPDADEWKVMGAAAYGEPDHYQGSMHRLVSIREDGGYQLDLNLFAHYDFDTPSLLSDAGKALLGPPRRPGGPVEQRHFDIAAAAQQHLEDVLFHILRWLRKKTGLDSVCLGGGVMMNSVFNGKATLDGPFSKLHVPFAPDDSGNAIGAALAAAQELGPPSESLRRFISPYLGPEYDDATITAILERYGIAHDRLDDPADTASNLLAGGKVLGWFQGRMEFGQRALGNRSILADPRVVSMRDRINSTVKYREGFRPFAPAVLEEAKAEFFEIDGSATSAYMERVFQVRAERQKQIPAVVHADGSGRLQTVTKEGNPLFHSLIEKFRDKTGVPVVVNTSFNTSGEPIVESPDDALRTFFTSGLDALILGRHLIRK